MHELAPAENLAHEAFLARERDIHLENVGEHIDRQQPVQMQQRRDAS